MGDVTIAVLLFLASMLCAGLGFFLARAINQTDRTSSKQGRVEVALVRLAERLDAMERTGPLLLDQRSDEGQRALAYDQNKIRDELGKIRTDVAAVEGDVTGKLNSFMAEVRATFASINDRLAARDAQQAESQSAQREILEKVNSLSVSMARMEARLEPNHSLPSSSSLGPGERRVLEMLAQLAAKERPQ